jgi:hypothetical protein
MVQELHETATHPHPNERLDALRGRVIPKAFGQRPTDLLQHSNVMVKEKLRQSGRHGADPLLVGLVYASVANRVYRTLKTQECRRRRPVAAALSAHR